MGVVTAGDGGGPDQAISDDLRRYASLIGDLGGVPTEPMRLHRGPTLSGKALAEQRSDMAALVVIHSDLTGDGSPQLPVDVPTVSDHDALAITLTTAVLTALSRVRRPTSRGRVVVVESRNLPFLASLLVAVEAGEVTMWDTPDAARFSLHKVIDEADVIVDLLGGIPTPATDDGPVVVTPDLRRDPLLVLPGLARALLGYPDVRFDRADPFGEYYDICEACALALVMATPPDQLSPPAPSRELSDRIYSAATRAMREARKGEDADGDGR